MMVIMYRQQLPISCVCRYEYNQQLHFSQVLVVNNIWFGQVLSRRIHYGRQVAEVKFSDAPQDYSPAIRAKVIILLTQLDNIVPNCNLKLIILFLF